MKFDPHLLVLSHTACVVMELLYCVILACCMDSQLRTKRLKWYGHVCRMLDTRLPKVMLLGQVKGSNPLGQPMQIKNDSVLSDFQRSEYQTSLQRRSEQGCLAS